MSNKSLIINEVKVSSYFDSVALMRLSKKITDIYGVKEAAVMMGTPANKKILADAGLLLENSANCSSNDMIIAVRAESKIHANDAIKEIEKLLDTDIPKERKKGV